MSDKPDFKWVVGIVIAILAAGGGVAAWIGIFRPQPHPQPQPNPYQQSSSSTTETVKPVACSISGRVLDSDTNQPIANVQVSYFRLTQDPNTWVHGVKSQLGTTGADGSFTGDCAAVERENFPLRVQLTKSDWGLTFQTNEYVQYGQSRTDVNMYVREAEIKAMQGH